MGRFIDQITNFTQKAHVLRLVERLTSSRDVPLINLLLQCIPFRQQFGAAGGECAKQRRVTSPEIPRIDARAWHSLRIHEIEQRAGDFQTIRVNPVHYTCPLC